MLGRHGTGGAEDDAGFCGWQRQRRRVGAGIRGAFVDGFGEAEVEDVDDAFRRHFGVAGFPKVDDRLLVRRFQRFGDLLRERQRPGQWQRGFQRVALDQLHHDGLAFKAVDCMDVQLIQRRQRLRFVLAASEAIGIVGQRGGQHFDADVAIQLRIGRPIDLTNTAFANQGNDFVRLQFLAGRECHLVSAFSLCDPEAVKSWVTAYPEVGRVGGGATMLCRAKRKRPCRDETMLRGSPAGSSKLAELKKRLL